MSRLSPKQQALLDYLARRVNAEGRIPSLREAAADLAISHAAVAQGLKALEEKGFVQRGGRYSRTVHLLNPARQVAAPHRWREIPIIGRVTAGLPMYAQQEWDGTLILDGDLFNEQHLFALRVQGDSMRDAAILNADLVVCTPRQYARNGEIIVALVHHEEATVKRFFLHSDRIELRPENPDFQPMFYNFDEVLVQGKVVGVQRGPEGFEATFS
jgi:repressor LexA